MAVSRILATGEGDIQDLLNELRQEMMDPSSSIYMPKIVLSQTQPVMDPYAAGDWDMNTITGDAGTTAAQNVCNGTNPNPMTEAFIPVPGQLPALALNSVNVVGLANVELTQLNATGPDGLTAVATAQFSKLSGSVDGHTLAPHIQLTGRFKLSQMCCASGFGGTTCTGSSQAEVGTGSFTATIATASGGATLQLTLQPTQQTKLLVQATQMSFNVSSSDIKVSVIIDNIPHQDSWDNVANTVMNSPEALDFIMSQINQVIAQPSALSQLGDALTSQVNDYLRANHQYPYDNTLMFNVK